MCSMIDDDMEDRLSDAINRELRSRLVPFLGDITALQNTESEYEF
jgi:hypothetical protein